MWNPSNDTQKKERTKHTTDTNIPTLTLVKDIMRIQVKQLLAFAVMLTGAFSPTLAQEPTYKATVAAKPIPAKDFWSFMAYDSQTRSILETDQITGGLDSNSA